MKRIFTLVLSVLLLLGIAGCGGNPSSHSAPPSDASTSPSGGEDSASFPDELYLEPDSGLVLEFSENEVPLSAAPAVSAMLMPKADGTVVYSNGKAAIDASHMDEGYVMIRRVGKAAARLKVIVTGPSGMQYTYNLSASGNYEVFPLSDGSGTYKIGIYQNISGTKYSTLFSQKVAVKLKNEFVPFLMPNQYVNYSESSKAVSLAKQLTRNCKTDLDKIAAVYRYVINNIQYDTAKAKTVKSGYLPNVDAILAAKKGICFDYAALMAAMLRSQGVPTKLVVGYTGSVYHAWINTYSEKSGWIQGVIFFDGTTWKLMDPTFASSACSSEKIMKYIGNGNNYSAKYLY